MVKQKLKTSSHQRFVAVWLGVAAGIIYNSWPLGYWLNPYVAQHDLASELEALHKPFNWLFITGDVLSSALIIICVALLWQWPASKTFRHRRLWALINLGLFAVGTIFDALLPLRCDPTIQRCPVVYHDPILLAHGFFSIVASLCLFISVVLVWSMRRRSPLMNGLIIGYVFFAVFSLISLLTPGQDSWAQHYALMLDGVCLAAIPYALGRPAKA